LTFALSLFWCQDALRLITASHKIHETSTIWSPSTSDHQIDTFPRSQNQVQLSSVSSDPRQIGDFPLNCFIPQLSTISNFPPKSIENLETQQKSLETPKQGNWKINWNSAQKWENFRKIISLILNRSFFQIDRVSLYNLKENLELVVACFSFLFQWIKYHSPTS
jgi:hypothetical protein